MKIAIYGLGYVGLTAAACLTKQGHTVLGVDVSAEKIDKINAGQSPITEPGLEELLATARTEGRLSATNNPGAALNDCQMAIVCVGTPSAPDGSHNMSFIAEVSRQIAGGVDPKRTDPLTVVFRSTIRPGTLELLVRPVFEATLGKDFTAVELVYNPEFLRESVAIRDYFNPPKIVIGTKDGLPSKNMDILNEGIDAPVFYTGYREAEITKFVDNSFHAVKVAFANEIGRVCVQLGVSAKKVHEIFISDTKLNISPYYMRPGGAFGGSCLPKDVRALMFMSEDVGAQTHLVDSLIRSNEAHKRFLFDYATKDVAPGGRVLLLGLAFKSDSDDLRESPNLDLARRLLQAGFQLSVYDPALKPATLIGQNLGYAYAHLPNLTDILIDEKTAMAETYDVVLDTSGKGGALCGRAPRSVNLSALP